MKALFIGGTGTISSAVSALAVKRGWELYLINRGNHTKELPQGVHLITADIYDEADVRQKLAGMFFDTVCDFIVFDTNAAERDYRLFGGKCNQYIFISSASAYQKPLAFPIITESTPLVNPYWQYSRNKIACEEYFIRMYRENGFPVTIVRPSHTYGNINIPVAVHGKYGAFSVLERIRTGKPVIIHGDGSSLWTLTHNTDFAKGFVGLMGNSHTLGEAYHITSDESLTWNQIYEILGSAVGKRPEIVHIPSDTLTLMHPDFYGALLGDKANSVIFDNTKVKRAVPDFVCTTPFDIGARMAVKNIYAAPSLMTPDPEFDNWCDSVAKFRDGTVNALPKF